MVNDVPRLEAKFYLFQFVFFFYVEHLQQLCQKLLKGDTMILEGNNIGPFWNFQVMFRGEIELEVVVVGRDEAGAIEEWGIKLVLVLY